MAEIIISDPETNRDPGRAFSSKRPLFAESLRHWFKDLRVSPESHPRVIDLAAGEGSMARLLSEQGWDQANMVCVDMRKPPSSLAPAATWHYWDLEQLAHHILSGETIPPEIQRYRSAFDISVLQYAPFRDLAETLVNFFTRPGGITIAEGDVKLLPREMI